MSLHCDIPPGSAAVLVGALEQGSGPGIAVYACDPCVTRHGIVPFEEMPASVTGVHVAQDAPRGIRRAR